MVADDRQKACSRPQRGHDVLAHHRVLLHDGQLAGIERARLEEDRVGDADLADVVDQAAAIKRVEV